MQPAKIIDPARIAQDLQIRKVQVESVVQLLDEGNTVPFITRYRKEKTGGLDEEVIRQVQRRVTLMRQLAERKETVLKSIENQGKLTEDLRQAILAAETPKRLEDLYLPFKPKKKTLASIARDRGLESLALAVWSRDPAVANLAELLPTMVNPEKELATPEDVQLGVQHILAEQIAETADVRHAVRLVLWDTGKLCSSKKEGLPEDRGREYKDYFQFSETVRHIPPHRILAINRGEKEGVLTARIEFHQELARSRALEKLPLADHPHAEFLKVVAEDALTRLVIPSLEREVRRDLTDDAERHAVQIFARNLHSLLLQPPLHGKRVLAIDPGYRTGCKVAVLDECGNLLEDAVVFPIPLHRHSKKPPAQTAAPAAPAVPAPTIPPEGAAPVPETAAEVPAAPPPPAEKPEPEKKEPASPPTGKKRVESRSKLDQLIRKYQVNVIAIGNGTACRETEEFVSELIAGYEKSRRENGQPAQSASAPAAVTTGTPAMPPPVEALKEDKVLEANAPASPGGVPTAAVVAPEAGSPIPPTTAPAAEVPMPEPPPPIPSTVVAPEGGFVIPFATVPPAPEPPAVDVREAVAAPPPVAAPEGGSPFPPMRLEDVDPSLKAAAELASLPPPPPELAYVIVNEAGASVYSASAVGREEFPNLDATLRGTISIGRRLQDPLSELVKIDPQSIGVGLYQHDVNPKNLKETLEAVVESSVNHVGVDVNTASVPLLRYVSGLNQLVARDLVEFRRQHGPFKNRDQLLQVPNLGPARFTQAAGFLKISGGDNSFDQTWIHPESYAVARQLLADLGYGPEALADRDKTQEVREKVKTLLPQEAAARLQVGLPTLQDILDSLARPGRDPREDLPPPVFKKGILKLEDLQSGMELKGTVLNVVDFGAFVDVGLKDSGLVHISQMANRFIKSPYEVVSVGDVVTVWVLSVEHDRHRVSLTMIQPGTERKPPEKGAGRPQQARPPQQGGRPPGGKRRPPPRPARAGAPGQAAARAPATGQATTAESGPATSRRPPPRPQQRPPLPPRKPKRQAPKPKLSQAALEQKVPLRSFGELEVFFESRDKKDEKEQPPPPPAEPGPPNPEAGPAVSP